MNVRRIGILGGTFNPVHYGHLLFAEWCCESLNLDKVIFIPAYIAPHKKIGENNADYRYKMLKIACKGNPRFEVSDIEIKERRVSYSVHTLRKLKRRYGKGIKLFFLIGADSLNILDTWKDIETALRLARFVAVNRPGFPIKRDKAGITYLRMPQTGISSSLVRERVRSRKSVRYLVPDGVREFIASHEVYR